MSELKRVYHVLHSEFDRIESKEYDAKEVFVVDEATGSLVTIAEGIPEEADFLYKLIKKKNHKTIRFAMVWQETQINMARILTGNSMRILTYLVGCMKYDNCVYGITQRKLSEALLVSSRTVIRSVQELIDVGVLVITGKKGNRIYHINPAYVWKGSFYSMRYKMKMFSEKMLQEDSVWKKK